MSNSVGSGKGKGELHLKSQLPFSTLLVLDRKLPVGRSTVNHYWEHFDGIYFRPRCALPWKENSLLSILIQKQLFTSGNKGRGIGNHLD